MTSVWVRPVAVAASSTARMTAGSNRYERGSRGTRSPRFGDRGRQSLLSATNEVPITAAANAPREIQATATRPAGPRIIADPIATAAADSHMNGTEIHFKRAFLR